MGASKTPYCIKKCDYCGMDVPIFHKERLTHKHIFCSHLCESNFYKEKNANMICPICSKKFHRKPCKIKNNKWPPCCSIECSSIYRQSAMIGENNHQYGLKGDKNASWKSDYKITNYGYLKKRSLEHPFQDCDGFVSYHKLVAESYLLNDENSIEINGKKYLKPELIVHHKNENKLDNDPDNLEIMDAKEHVRYHRLNKSKNNNAGKKSIAAFVYPLKEIKEEEK